MALSHSEEDSGISVVQYESHILGFTVIVVSVVYGCGDAQSSIQPILHEGWTRVSKPCGMIDDVLVCAAYYDRGRW